MQGAQPLLHCIASAQVGPFPQKVEVFRHEFAGVVVVAITLDSNSLSLSQIPSIPNGMGNSHRATGGSFFTIGEIKAPNILGEEMKSIKVRVPKHRVVSNLTFVPSGDGKDLYVLVQCIESNDKIRLIGSEVVGKTYTYLYKRMEELKERTDGLLDEKVVDSEVVVRYKRFPDALDLGVRNNEPLTPFSCDISFPWSSVSWLPGFCSASHGTAPSTFLSPRIVAASTPPGRATALHVLQVAGIHTRLEYSIEVDALCQFPISSIVPIPGYGSTFIALCHNSVVEIDLKKVESTSTSPVQSSNALLTRAWRCASEVPLTSVTVRDHLLLSGSATGSVLLWDLRGEKQSGMAPKAAAQIQDSVSPISGIYACDASTFFTCSLDGKLICWQTDCLDSYDSESCLQYAGVSSTFSFPFTPTEIPIPVLSHEKTAPFSFLGQSREPWVSMAGEGNIVAVLGEYGSLYVFLRS